MMSKFWDLANIALYFKSRFGWVLFLIFACSSFQNNDFVYKILSRQFEYKSSLEAIIEEY